MEIRKTIVKTKFGQIWVDDEGMLCLRYNEYTDVDLEVAKHCFKVYEDLGYGKGNKALQIMDGRLHFTMTKEARDFVAENGKKFFIAAAFISNNLSMRLLFNFFNSFYKHEVPFKMFGTEKKAREWLMKFRIQSFKRINKELS
jgi:hypothetical protein